MNERKITGWLARGGIVAVINVRQTYIDSFGLPALSPYNCCGWGDGGARGASEFKHRVGVEMGIKG